MLPPGNNVGRRAVHADMPRHREYFQVHGGHRTALLIGDERVS
jgi:hypothetical protein